MSNFPLYDSLNSKIDDAQSSIDLNIKEKDEFIRLVKKMDNVGYELIYVLIRVYQLENTEDKSTFKLPFGGKFIKDDIKFDLNEMPIRLKHILNEFVHMHILTLND